MATLTAAAASATPTRRRVGLLAGWGRYPIVLAEALRAQGSDVYCVGIKGHVDPSLASLCDGFTVLGMGRGGRMIRFFKRHGVTDATMAGKIFKERLLKPGALLGLVPDLRSFRLICKHYFSRKGDNKDDTLLLSVVREFARDGIHFAAATDLAPELLVKFGQLTRRAPSGPERSDIAFGWQLAKEMGRLDVGQSVAVKHRVPVAVEALEGTDQCIVRAGTLCSGGFTVVKVAKPQQDMRFDVPAIGLGTLESMVASGARCLAVEADRTIILDEPELIRFADAHGLAIVAVHSADDLPEPAAA